ncbi:hypothetical protein MACJ_003385 [Theileria orientalis]|uniref:Uncharacterized protein n=1 Tax=Theileria orientalis TaxID=68886 RepID=A0A976SK99_THEOR|nr:hypothetical protein MACJ_003385 [Theileria orientalis]
MILGIIRNETQIRFKRIFYKNELESRPYTFINKIANLNYKDVFKLEAAKKKTTPTKKTTTKSGTKTSGKKTITSKNTPKKKVKKLSKSQLGAMKAKAKAPKKKEKKVQIFGRSKVTLEEEDKEEIQREYERRIAVTDTASYTEKMGMEMYQDLSKPYMALFDAEKITKEDLRGFDMPYGLVPRERYELWKLCGRVSDPCAPFSSQSLTTRMFNQRLFGKEYEITRDDFNYKIEYKMKFYVPGYGEIFFMDKIRCWRAWYLARDCKYGPEDLPTYSTIYPLARPPDNVPLSHVMLSVNSEINRQGVHPAVLDMFWNFFTDDPNVLTRDIVTYKLNWITERLSNIDPQEGISPDHFYRVFYEPCKKAMENFDKEEFLRKQHASLHEISTHKMLMMNNKALRVRNRILKEAYNDELKQLYKTIVPRSYTRYERSRLAGYYNMLNHMYQIRERKKLMPPKVKPPTLEELGMTKAEILLHREIERSTLEEKRKEQMKRRKARRSKKKKKK